MRQQQPSLDALGVAVVVVTFQGAAFASAYVRETGVSWPILLDEQLNLYTAYGMERGRWWHVFGPEAWWIYARLLWRGRKLRAPTGDPQQLGGDVLIDPRGIVRLHHVGRGPADRPAVSAILECVRSAARD